ncbi:MAG: glycosyltransferase family 2 protein [Acidimicrobiales bacterium]|nr:glycosyltransferase family 2 protein [Acidimicrobiales bacterium]
MTDAPPAAQTKPAGAAPAVVAVVVTHDPGDWLEECLRSLAAQTYESLSVLVVDTGSAEDPTGRVASVLPDARVRRLDDDPGYGAATNEVLAAVEGAAFYLLCHDDVALAPNAVRVLVEEAFRTNGGVLGPKLVDWHEPDHIRSVGGAVDKAGVPAPYAEPGEPDQEQHDAIRDVFHVDGGAVLVRADLFATLGGFDPGISFLGDDVDLCWRAHVAGARVVVVPSAVVRHLEALGERRPHDDRRRLQQRHRLRSVLSNYRRGTLVRVLPQALLFSLVEALAALLSGRFRHVADVVGAWTWNLRRLPAVWRRRRRLARVRTVSDAEVRHLQVRGSARLTASLRGQVGGGDDRLGALAATGRDLGAVMRAPLTRVSVVAAVVTLALMLIGSRNLLLQPLPAVGELSAFPDSPLDLLRSHLSSWRSTSGGGEGPSPTGAGAAGLLGLLTLGSMSAARKLAVLALLPAGPLAMWRLARPIGSIRAAAAAVVVYAAVPLPYNALAGGSWSALAAYAVGPWIVLGLARASGLAPFGPIDLADEEAAPLTVAADLPSRIVGLGLTLALGALVAPAVVPLAVLMTLGLGVGSVVAGRSTGVARMFAALTGGMVVAVVLHLPWSASIPGQDWTALVGADETSFRPLGELLRFQTGPFGNTPLGWAFLLAAALPLVIGRGWRLAWAVRAWFLAVASWALLLLAERGDLPFDLPVTELVLVPAAVGLAFATALGMAAFEVDLRHYRFGWRQALSVAAALSVVVGGVTLAPGIVDGRWRVPRGDLNRALAPTLTSDGEREARILWLGDRSILPLGGQPYRDDVSLATSDGLPEVTDRWPGAAHASTDRLFDAVDLAAARRTVQMGHLLAAEGVRYVVVPVRSVPEAYRGHAAAPPGWLTDLLAAQIDLQRIDTEPSLIVYRNVAWRGDVAAVESDLDLPGEPRGATTAGVADPDVLAGAPTDVDRYEVDAPGDRDLLTRLPADGRWSIDVDGVETDAAFGWAARHRDVPAGTATIGHSTPLGYRALVLVQPLLWLAAVLVRNRASSRARRAVGLDQPDPVEPPADGPEDPT